MQLIVVVGQIPALHKIFVHQMDLQTWCAVCKKMRQVLSTVVRTPLLLLVAEGRAPGVLGAAGVLVRADSNHERGVRQVGRVVRWAKQSGKAATAAVVLLLAIPQICTSPRLEQEVER